MVGLGGCRKARPLLLHEGGVQRGGGVQLLYEIATNLTSHSIKQTRSSDQPAGGVNKESSTWNFIKSSVIFDQQDGQPVWDGRPEGTSPGSERELSLKPDCFCRDSSGVLHRAGGQVLQTTHTSITSGDSEVKPCSARCTALTTGLKGRNHMCVSNWDSCH